MVSTTVDYDRDAELKAFDETKAGVKGLVDSGITEIPRIFHMPSHLLDQGLPFPADDPDFLFPIIDLQDGQNPEKRKQIVEKIGDAAKNWGFFQIVNHGTPIEILEEMIAGVHRFFNQDVELKKKVGVDMTKEVVYYPSNPDLYTSEAANWRDSILYRMTPNPPEAERLPACSREIVPKYSAEMLKLGDLVFQLLSESLSLPSDYLKELDCMEVLALGCHYYPACPQPKLTLGPIGHADLDFLTLLLQDNVGGLQIRRKGHWVDVPFTKGAIVVNIGEMLQLLSNDKFTSVEHRVIAKDVGPRVSIAGFFGNGFSLKSRMYGPIKETLSEDNPPLYKNITIKDFFALTFKNGIGKSVLPLLKL